MITKTQTFVQDLRALPLHIRHWILWSGSLLIFLLIGSVWVWQMAYQLKTAFNFGVAPRIVKEVPQKQTHELVSEDKSQLSQALDLLKQGTAGIFSVIKNYQKDDAVTSHNEKGQELDQFLKYQKEYHQDFPKNP